VTEPEGAPPPLPRRPPRPLVVHFLVDAAVVFAASALVLSFFLRVPIEAVAIGSGVAGAAAAPFTRRAEARALAARRPAGDE
jgi:hypothetical protein